MAVFDATTLIHLFEPNAPAVMDPSTGKRIPDAKERVQWLIETLSEAKEKVIIPTPALSEVLVHAEQAVSEYLAILHKSSSFRIVPFDERAAIELATVTHDAINKAQYRIGSNATRATLKFDRQILAIARVEGETTVYSDDSHMRTLGSQIGIQVIPTHQLPLPPSPQLKLPPPTP